VITKLNKAHLLGKPGGTNRRTYHYVMSHADPHEPKVKCIQYSWSLVVSLSSDEKSSEWADIGEDGISTGYEGGM